MFIAVGNIVIKSPYRLLVHDGISFVSEYYLKAIKLKLSGIRLYHKVTCYRCSAIVAMYKTPRRSTAFFISITLNCKTLH